MRKLNVLVTVLCFAMLGNWPAVAQSPAVVTVVKADRLLDPRTGNVLAPAAVLIEGGKIKQVGSPSQVQPLQGARIIDLGRATFP
jgi:imidazolonepropionase-like amidohydrolase